MEKIYKRWFFIMVIVSVLVTASSILYIRWDIQQTGLNGESKQELENKLAELEQSLVDSDTSIAELNDRNGDIADSLRKANDIIAGLELSNADSKQLITGSLELINDTGGSLASIRKAIEVLEVLVTGSGCDNSSIDNNGGNSD